MKLDIDDLRNDNFSLEIDQVETHILTELLDEKIGNLVTLPPYVDASRYTSQIIGIRKKLDYILLDIRKGKR